MVVISSFCIALPLTLVLRNNSVLHAFHLDFLSQHSHRAWSFHKVIPILVFLSLLLRHPFPFLKSMPNLFYQISCILHFKTNSFFLYTILLFADNHCLFVIMNKQCLVSLPKVDCMFQLTRYILLHCEHFNEK